MKHYSAKTTPPAQNAHFIRKRLLFRREIDIFAGKYTGSGRMFPFQWEKMAWLHLGRGYLLG
jgi:hypothetical protein